MSEADRQAIERLLHDLNTGEKLELIDSLKHSLQGAPPPEQARNQRQAYQELCRKLAALPVENPADGFSNRNHDQLLYGE